MREEARMATITTSLGVGSGIDIKGTVSQLTAAEGKPQLDAIAAKTDVSQAKLSGLGTLKGALSSFQNAVKALDKSATFSSQQISSTDEKILKVAAVPGTTAASHTVKVNSLAKPQRSVSTSEFKSTEVVKAGLLIFNDSTNSPKFSVEVVQGQNDTLTGLRDAINNAKNNNSVVASIVNVDSKTGGTISKLVLTSKTPGVDNAFSVDASLGDMRFNLNKVLTPGNFSTVEASDANVVVDPQKLAASAQRSISTTEFGELDVLAPGLITFKDKDGNDKFSVNITAGNNDKVFAAMDAINNAEGNDLVTASVVNVTSKADPELVVSKLVFAAKKPGIDNSFSVDASKGDNRFTTETAPADAQKSVAAAEFGATDTVKAGIIKFKSVGGTETFSVEIKNDIKITTTNGELDADGNLIVDENGDPIKTVVTETGVLNEDGTPVITTEKSKGTKTADGLPTVTTEVIKGNSSLEGLRDAINFSPENKYVVASIVSTTTPAIPATDEAEEVPAKTVSKLVLTSLVSGAENGFTIDASGGDTRFNFDPINSPENFTNTTTVASYDTTDATNEGEGGQIITRSTNSISDAVPGVTLTLVAEGTTNIEAQLDQGSIQKPISSFVDAYNKLNETLKQLTIYVKPGDPGNGPLLGDSTVQSISTRVKELINSKVSTATGDYNSLNQLGITFDKKGVMMLDSTTLDKALTGNLTSVGNVFASNDGVATKLNTAITQYLDAKSSLSTQQDSLNKQLVQLTTEKNAVEKRLEATQKSLQQQFIAMDTAVSKFKSTGDFLTQALTPKTTN